MVALVLFVSIILFVAIGPWLWTIDPTFVDYRARNQGFSTAHPLGTDQLGRDMLARMMTGGRVSIAVGLVAMSIALTLGSLIGVVSGYFKRLDAPLMRLTEPVSGAAAAALAVADGDAVSRTSGSEAGPSGRDIPADRRGHRGDLVDADGADRQGRCSGPERARIHSGRKIHRHARAAYDPAPCAAQCDLADHGGGDAGYRDRDHHRKRAVISGAGLSAGFPDLGAAAVRCGGSDAAYIRGG